VPVVLRVGPYRFFFYPADRNEPRHVHVERDDKEAKFWLDPSPRMVYNHGFGAGEIRQILKVIYANLVRLRRRWDAFFA
jgi:hypothetical protein